jgi:hypothetical protein
MTARLPTGWTPMMVAGITSSPNSSTPNAPDGRIHHRGRPSASAWESADRRARLRRCRESGRRWRARFVADMHQPSALVGFLRCNSATPTPQERAKPSAALVGWPSGPKAALKCRTAPFELAVGLPHRQMVDQHRQAGAGWRSGGSRTGQTGFFQTLANACSKARDRLDSALGGNSSVPISISRSRCQT